MIGRWGWRRGQYQLEYGKDVTVRLTAKGHYSVTAIVDLSMHSESKPIAHADIATCYSVPSLSKTFVRDERRDPAKLFIGKSAHAR